MLEQQKNNKNVLCICHVVTGEKPLADDNKYQNFMVVVKIKQVPKTRMCVSMRRHRFEIFAVIFTLMRLFFLSLLCLTHRKEQKQQDKVGLLCS